MLVCDVQGCVLRREVGRNEEAYPADRERLVARFGLIDEPGSHLFAAHTPGNRDADTDAFGIHPTGVERAT